MTLNKRIVKEVYGTGIVGCKLQLWNKVLGIEKRILCKLPPKMNLRPPFLLNNQMEGSLVAVWVRKNLDNFSAEGLSNYILEELMIRMTKQQIMISKGKIGEDANESLVNQAINTYLGLLDEEVVSAKRQEILDEHHLNHIYNSTIYRWLKYLGYVNKKFEKSLNCDGHEAGGTVKDRIAFLIKYLEVQHRTHSWVLITDTAWTP